MVEHKAGAKRAAKSRPGITPPPLDVQERMLDSAAGRDITVCERAEEGLRGSEIRYRRLFEAAQDGILILDFATGRVVDVNPFLTNLLGYSHAELAGKDLWEIHPDEDISAIRVSFADLQTQGVIRYDDLPL